MNQRRAGIALALSLLLLLALAGAIAIRLSESPVPAAAPPESRWYALYLTRPGERHHPDHQTIDEGVVARIDAATATIDAAIYEMDLAAVARSLVAAARRGVQVRVVTDGDTIEARDRDPATDEAFAILERAGVPIRADTRSAIMHHKFAVFDRAIVWTGSWNWTEGDSRRLDNNAVSFTSPDVAADYAAEFERLFAGRFGSAKDAGARRDAVAVGPARVRVFFAPEDRIAPAIETAIRQATSEVQFLAFAFTHDGIGRALIDLGPRAVRVRGVFDRTMAGGSVSEFARLLRAGFEVYQDGNPGFMHHKVVVIDRKVTIVGSLNFSAAGIESNDENVLMIEDVDLASDFVAETDRVVAVARRRG
ncbi:MAG: phospholipase [Chloroflexi bacterium]|nr:phospholipase [Chloroflexota bacterium]